MLFCNWIPTKNANSSLSNSGCGAAATRTCRRMTLRKSITAASRTPTNIMPPAFRDGRPTAGACTSCGDRRTRLNRTRRVRSEEHTSELQSHSDLVCRLLLEKKKKKTKMKKKRNKSPPCIYKVLHANE